MDRETGAGRLACLDAFRGITILLMFLVNNLALGERTPRFLIHAPFGGISVADLVFPWFILILGISAPLSARSHCRRGGTAAAFFRRTLRRVTLLFLSGCFLDSTLASAPRFGMGVLQLLALDAGVAGGFALCRRPARLAGAALLLGIHSELLVWGAGGLVAAGTITESANAHVVLTRSILAPFGLQGLLSVVPTAGLALLGGFAADLLIAEFTSPGRKALGILLLGTATATVGFVLGGIIPFGKAIWSVSYLLLAGGLGLILLGLLFAATVSVGVPGWSAPLRALGSNPLFAYSVPIYFKATVLQDWRVGEVTLGGAILATLRGHFGVSLGGWIWTGSYIVFWWGVIWALERRGVRWSA
jgi:predicted acyltransferase